METQKPKTKRRKLVWAIVLAYFVLLSLSVFTRVMVSNSNYTYNQTAEILYKQSLGNSFINNQPATKVFKVGVTTSDNNGCGWIAIYNANKILGISVDIADIINEIDVWGVNFYGLLGINPFAIKSFYDKRGYQTKFITNTNEFEEGIKQSKVSVMAYFSLEGGHYQAVEQYGESQIRLYTYQRTTTLQNYFEGHKNTIKFLITIN